MKVIYNADNTASISATATEFNALAFAVVNMVNTTGRDTLRQYRAILADMEKAYQTYIKTRKN